MLLKSSFLHFTDSLSQILTYNKTGTENPKLTLNECIQMTVTKEEDI